MKDLKIYWNQLVWNDVATEKELDLITKINGLNEETLNDVLFARTGYRDWDDYFQSELAVPF